MSNKNNTPGAPSIEELQAKVESLEAIVLDQNNQIENYKAKLSELENSGKVVNSVTVQKEAPKGKLIPEKVFKVGGKSYRFAVAQFRLDGDIVKAVDALEKPELLKEIVEKYTPLVEQVK